MKIAEAAIDERGQTAWGKKGDQADEVRIRTMTGGESGSGTFTKILRFPDTALRRQFAKCATEIALNQHVGYAQYGDDADPYAGRYGLWNASQGVKSFADVDVYCNTDCSQMLSTNLNFNGIRSSMYMRTATEVKELTGLGFLELPFSVEACLLGDVLWRQGHTAVVVEAPEGEGGELMFSAKLISSKDEKIWSTGAGPKTRSCPYVKVKKSAVGFTPNVIVIQQLGEILANSQWMRGQAHLYCANFQNDATAGVAVGKVSSYFNPDADEIVIPVRFPGREYLVRIYP